MIGNKKTEKENTFLANDGIVFSLNLGKTGPIHARM